jgi:endonuclease YncB( thermonuclease family)
MRVGLALVPVAALVLLVEPVAAADQLRISDGDTIRIGNERIRLWGIDAPELTQTCRLAGQW